MMTLITRLLNDENGFVVSAELVLITTIAVLGLVVGLSEISHSINNELEDVGSAFGSMNQSFRTTGLHSCSLARTAGSQFHDAADLCDSECDIEISGAWAED